MPYYIAFLETIDPEKDAEILEVHKAYLQKYINEGKIYAKGPFTDHTGGLIIYKTNSYEEAKLIAENDPVIKENSRKMTFKEWKSTLPE
ncbi:YciI family protein [Alkaliphilus transvaalensis]|uniref:YciI family protein n=1 Tax=Alkaliphilus transvaalensis TaxID=114628 RepID=UPI000478F19E|nr:YciI family protein [Alkaliphilus transvaalensis]